MTLEELISYCPEEIETWKEEMKDGFFKVPIIGWLSYLIFSGDKRHYLRQWCVPKVFKYGISVKNNIGRKGTVVDIDDRNNDGAGCGPVPYIVVKFEDEFTKKYDYSELELVK